MTAPALVVLHEPGDGAAGAPWREAADDVGWPAPVLAPDLPGHGDEPAPVGGTYESTDAALFVVRRMADAGPDLERPLVLGVGRHGWAGELFALGGRAVGLVLLDGLGGPWRSPADTIAAGARSLRAIADDPAALGPPPGRGLDPRLRHGVAPMASRATAERAAASVSVPVLVLSTPNDPLSPDQRDDLVTRFPTGADVVELPDRSPAAVLAATRAWVEDRDIVAAGAAPSGA